jgi:hypothetical protein
VDVQQHIQADNGDGDEAEDLRIHVSRHTIANEEHGYPRFRWQLGTVIGILTPADCCARKHALTHRNLKHEFSSFSDFIKRDEYLLLQNFT